MTSVFCEHRCSLEKQEEECIVGMDSSSLNLSDCCMQSSQGPAVDMSGASKLSINRGNIEQCVGKSDWSCPAILFTHQVYTFVFCRWGLDVGQQPMRAS